jgi:hypothetical protein
MAVSHFGPFPRNLAKTPINFHQGQFNDGSLDSPLMEDDYGGHWKSGDYQWRSPAIALHSISQWRRPNDEFDCPPAA